MSYDAWFTVQVYENKKTTITIENRMYCDMLYFYRKIYEIIFHSKVHNYESSCIQIRGTAVAQWLRCCATNRNVAGSIPDGVIGIFH